jgi:uncharacterized damage-inducible protein DinB
MSYVLGADAGLPPSLSGLLGMLHYARETTLQAVRGLSTAQLDQRHDQESNSIGALLFHLAAVEAWYQANTFDRREWSAEEAARWKIGIDLGPEAAREIVGHPLEHYTEILAEVRQRTERELREKDERWLLTPEPFGEVEANNYWKWFHVCEDEINHRGQIRWLRKRL